MCGGWSRARQIAFAGVLAGTVATLMQLLLAVVLGEDPATLLLRDAQLTAGIVVGAKVLADPPRFDVVVFLIATAVHFSLSIFYAALLFPVAKRLPVATGIVGGAVFGSALYVVNLYGFTELFPWFRQSRGATTAAAHLVFGIAAIFSYRLIGIGIGTGAVRWRWCRDGGINGSLNTETLPSEEADPAMSDSLPTTDKPSPPQPEPPSG